MNAKLAEVTQRLWEAEYVVEAQRSRILTLERERDAARAVARQLMPPRRHEDPHAMRWHARMDERYPWLTEEG